MSYFQQNDIPRNMRFGSTRYLTFNPSNGSEDDMVSHITRLQEREPINHQKSDINGLSRDQVDKTQSQILPNSNSYREKYGLDKFTLDDQVSEQFH